MANSMIGLKVKKTYEDLIGVAVSDKLYNIKFPNRDAKHLRDGFILSQLDSEGMRAMEKQQEMANKQAFKESLLKQIAINTGSNLSDLRSEHDQETRTERINNIINQTLPDFPYWATFDMARDDGDSSYDTPINTPFNTPGQPTADYSDRVNRSLDMEEEEQVNMRNKKDEQKEQIRKHTSQHLEDLQPKRHIDVDTKVLTRNYLNRIYESVSERERATEDAKIVRQELDRDERAEKKERKKEEKARKREKASGSKDTRTYEDVNPESDVEPKGPRGRPKNSPIPQQVRDMKVKSRLQQEKDELTRQESNLNSPTKNTLLGKQLKTIVKEYNLRTGSAVTTRKVKKHTKAFDEEGNEITKAAMVEIIVDQNKTMAKQALRT